MLEALKVGRVQSARKSHCKLVSKGSSGLLVLLPQKNKIENI